MALNEIHWTIISHMVPIVEIFIMGYCFYYFAKPFMEISSEYPLSYPFGKTKKKKWTCCVGITYILTMVILYEIPILFSTFMAYSVGVFVPFLVMCWAEQRNYEQKIFIAVTFFSLRWFTSAMAEILYDNLYDFILNTNYMRTHPNRSFALYIVVCLLYLALEFLFTIIGIRCVLKNYVCKAAKMSKKELFILIVPSFMGVVGYELIWYYRNFYIAELKKISEIYDILSLFYYIITIVVIVVVIVLYQKIKAGQEEKLQNELLAIQMEHIKEHIEQVENLYQGIRCIRHDMTNHIMTLERLYTGNKQKEAIAYSMELKAALSEVTGNINSGNPVTDVILQEMQRKADKKKIRFDKDFHYPMDSSLNVFDISVILNNALQNALEYTSKSETAYIAIVSYRRNNAYMIEVSNYFTGSLQWNTESGLPITSKKQKNDYSQSHGYGLLNIQKVAQKYLGDIVIDLKDDVFCLSILLMMET